METVEETAPGQNKTPSKNNKSHCAPIQVDKIKMLNINEQSGSLFDENEIVAAADGNA